MAGVLTAERAPRDDGVPLTLEGFAAAADGPIPVGDLIVLRVVVSSSKIRHCSSDRVSSMGF